MNRPPDPLSHRHPPAGFSLIKVAVIICSLTLVGGYVAYRSGGRILPSTKSGRIVHSTEQADADQTAGVAHSRVLSSSKWGPVVTPATAPARTVMPGSKSHIALEPEDVIFGALPTTQPATEPSQGSPHP